MTLTERDRVLLGTLQSYGCLRTSEISEKVFPGIRLTTVLRRLRILSENGFIQKIMGLDSTERLWALREKSLGLLHEPSAKLHFPKSILEHDSKLSSLRLLLEKEKLVESWVPEHQIRKQVATKHGIKAAARKVIPDGIAGVEVEVRGVKESIAIELELSIKNQIRYRDIFRDYSTKKNLWAVWYIVSNDSITRQILKARKSLYVSDAPPWILFSRLDDLMGDPLACEIHNGKDSNQVGKLFYANPVAPPVHPATHEVSSQAG